MQVNNHKLLKKVSKYQIFETVIGKGSSGTVHLGVNVENKQLVAVKIFDKLRLNSLHQIVQDQTIKNIKRESNLHKQLNHQNIVKLYDVFETKSSLYFFLEYCQQTLESYLQEQYGLLNELKIKNIFKQLLDAFRYLSQVQVEIDDENTDQSQTMRFTFGHYDKQHNRYQGICHRDLKPSNILILNDRILLGDFGLCRDLQTLNQSIGIGTPYYMSPNSLSGKETNDFQKNDIWSAGIILYEMLFNEHPWKSNESKMSELIFNILNKPLIIPEDKKYSNDLIQLLKGMLAIEESKRYDWQQINDNSWVKDESDAMKYLNYCFSIINLD